MADIITERDECLPLLNENHVAEKASFRQFMTHFWPTGLIAFGGPQARTFIITEYFAPFQC